MFKGKTLCIPQCSLREAIVWEAHIGGLVSHFVRDKTLSLVKKNFYWPRLERDVNKHIQRCRVYICHWITSDPTSEGFHYGSSRQIFKNGPRP